LGSEEGVSGQPDVERILPPEEEKTADEE